MSAIIQRNSATSASTASLTVAWPSLPLTGSILVLVANSTQGIATPSGWTLRASFAGDQGFYIWDKVATASEASVIVVPNSAAAVAATVLELNAVNVTGFDVRSSVNGASAANNAPCSSVTTTGIYGGDVLAVGALHGWTVAPDATPTYSGGWAHQVTALAPGTGATLVGHYIGDKTTTGAAATGTTVITQTAIIDNTAGFLISYAQTAPLVVVPLSAVNSSTGWTITGGLSALNTISDSLDTTTLVSGSLAGSSLTLDVQLGSMDKPPAQFVTRVRAARNATSGTVSGKLYDGATLIATSDTKPLPPNLGDTLITFAAVDIAGVVTAKWVAGLRMVLTVTAT